MKTRWVILIILVTLALGYFWGWFKGGIDSSRTILDQHDALITLSNEVKRLEGVEAKLQRENIQLYSNLHSCDDKGIKEPYVPAKPIQAEQIR